jgi:hypothetical protein
MHLHGNKTRTSDDLHFVNVSENSSVTTTFLLDSTSSAGSSQSQLPGQIIR